ncbi:XRE family transcriptional regulator [Mycobacteroides abscessus subsp. bolletii]|nr:XRE family transcriptional regulator [Mycobacteroides abscessus subsp. bolletii]
MARDKSIISSPRALGAFIHDARIERNLTQESLATLAGVSRSWLIGVEQGKRQRAEFDKILNVLEALDINLVLERQSAEQTLAPEPNASQNPVATLAPSDDITNMLKNSVPNFGQASGITQALNRQNQKNKTGNSSE